MSSRFSQSPDVAVAAFDGQTTLMEPTGGVYYGLDTIGSRIWALLEQPQGVDELVAALCEEFEVPVETCEADVRELLNSMVDRKLVRSS